MALSFLFALLVASSAAFERFLQHGNRQTQDQVAKCRDDLEILQSISKLEGQSVGDLQVAIDQAVGRCGPFLTDLDNKLAE